VGVSKKWLLNSLIRPLAPKLIRNDLLNDEVKLDLLTVHILYPRMQKEDSCCAYLFIISTTITEIN
jgi:hypothetical protein